MNNHTQCTSFVTTITSKLAAFFVQGYIFDVDNSNSQQNHSTKHQAQTKVSATLTLDKLLLITILLNSIQSYRPHPILFQCFGIKCFMHYLCYNKQYYYLFLSLCSILVLFSNHNNHQVHSHNNLDLYPLFLLLNHNLY